MKISLIVAAAENNAIGKDNQLLWHLPNDLRYFKNKTWGLPVVMGRKTFESFSGQVLRGRLNIVITRQQNWTTPQSVLVVNSFKNAISLAQQHDYKELMIAGGGEIYKEVLPHADNIYLTRVHTILDGDTFFPTIDTHTWQRISIQDFQADEKHAYNYSFEVWTKK